MDSPSEQEPGLTRGVLLALRQVASDEVQGTMRERRPRRSAPPSPDGGPAPPEPRPCRPRRLDARAARTAEGSARIPLRRICPSAGIPRFVPPVTYPEERPI